MKLGNQYGCGVQSALISLVPSAVPRARRTELSDIHDIILILQHGSLVVVHIEVVRCAEDGHDTGETSRPSLPVHAVSGVLSLVCANNGKQVVFLEESTCGRVREEVRATSDVIVDEEVVSLFLPELFERIGPEDVAHQSVCGWFAETINLRQSEVETNLPVLQRTLFRSSNVWSSGLRPPCIHKNCLFMTAANGRAQNESMHAS